MVCPLYGELFLRIGSTSVYPNVSECVRMKDSDGDRYSATFNLILSAQISHNIKEELYIRSRVDQWERRRNANMDRLQRCLECPKSKPFHLLARWQLRLEQVVFGCSWHKNQIELKFYSKIGVGRVTKWSCCVACTFPMNHRLMPAFFLERLFELTNSLVYSK